MSSNPEVQTLGVAAASGFTAERATHLATEKATVKMTRMMKMMKLQDQRWQRRMLRCDTCSRAVKHGPNRGDTRTSSGRPKEFRNARE